MRFSDVTVSIHRWTHGHISQFDNVVTEYETVSGGDITMDQLSRFQVAQGTRYLTRDKQHRRVTKTRQRQDVPSKNVISSTTYSSRALRSFSAMRRINKHRSPNSVYSETRARPSSVLKRILARFGWSSEHKSWFSWLNIDRDTADTFVNRRIITRCWEWTCPTEI